MRYRSTRRAAGVGDIQALSGGIMADGGLCVPSSFPSFKPEEIASLADMDSPERAAFITERFLNLDHEAVLEACRDAYASFDGGKACRVHRADSGMFILEMFRGPTLSGRDVSFFLLPRLLRAVMKKEGDGRKILAVAAEDNGTGESVLEGFGGAEGALAAVFYPAGLDGDAKGRLTSREGDNVLVCGVTGTAAETRDAVSRFCGKENAKRLSDRGYLLCPAGEPSWGRMLPLIAVFFDAYAEMVREGGTEPGDGINVVSAEGDLEWLTAAYYARKAGLPVERIVCACGENNRLAEFFTSGTLDLTGEFARTPAPALDAQPRNLERLLYDLSGSSPYVREKAGTLKKEGKLTVSPEIMEESPVESGFADRREAAAAADSFFDVYDYPLEPHAATALTVYNTYAAVSGDDRPAAIVAPYNPYLFAPDVYEAVAGERVENGYAAAKKLAGITSEPLPDRISEAYAKRPFRNDMTGTEGIEKTVTEFVGRN